MSVKAWNDEQEAELIKMYTEEGIKEVLIAVLCSPNFIYLATPENPESNEIDDEFYLASQLSYFLWN